MAAGGTIRGATAATTGSSKWPSSGREPPVGGHAVGVHERDERAGSGCQPGVACAGRPDVDGNATNRAPWRSAIALVAPGVGGRVVDHDAGQAARARRAAGRAATGRSRTGTTTVTSSGPNVPATPVAGQCAGRHQPPRQETVPTGSGPRGSRPPALDELPAPAPIAGTGAGGCLRGARVPSSKARVDGVLGRHERAGERSGSPRGRWAERRRVPGCVGVGHHPILAVRGRR